MCFRTQKNSKCQSALNEFSVNNSQPTLLDFPFYFTSKMPLPTNALLNFHSLETKERAINNRGEEIASAFLGLGRTTIEQAIVL